MGSEHQVDPRTRRQARIAHTILTWAYVISAVAAVGLTVWFYNG